LSFLLVKSENLNEIGFCANNFAQVTNGKKANQKKSICIEEFSSKTPFWLAFIY